MDFLVFLKILFFDCIFTNVLPTLACNLMLTMFVKRKIEFDAIFSLIFDIGRLNVRRRLSASIARRDRRAIFVTAKESCRISP